MSHTSRAKAYPPPFPWLNLRYWTLIEMLSASDTKWEIAVPNGTYLVTVGAGGPVLNGTRQKIRVENVLVVDDLPVDYSPWVAASATITVSDGRLTVSNDVGATKNWITFIEIVPQP